MDCIDTSIIDKICRMSPGGRKASGGPVDVLFYDCTTLAFDTEREDEAADQGGEANDCLLAKGFARMASIIAARSCWR